MIRCRADAILESQDFFTSLGETDPSSSRHLLSHNDTGKTHYSTQKRPQLWNKDSLPCGTVPLYCHCPLLHCCSWMSLFVISHDSNFICGHVSTRVSDDNLYPHKTPLRSQQAHTQARMQQDRTTKLEAWNFPMYFLTAQHFSAFPVHTAIGGRKGPRWAFSE